jgi:hypothetical protein
MHTALPGFCWSCGVCSHVDVAFLCDGRLKAVSEGDSVMMSSPTFKFCLLLFKCCTLSMHV